MKRNFNVLLVTLLIAFASCSFTSKSFDDPDKDKLLMKLITYLLEQGHFQPREINDDLSQAVYTSFLDQIDPFKNYFLKSDIDEFEEFKTELDNQILAHDVSFFNLVYDRFLIRFEDSRDMYSKVLELPFDFSLQEVYSTDYENNVYVNSKSDMFERWRKQLKFYTISNYYDLITADKKSQEADENFKSRPRSQIEIEARVSILKTMTENFSVLEDIRRQDWLSVYINAIAVEFDPHTFYFAPSDKDRFDAQMTGKYEGIGARLQKRMDEITITELISGGSAWRQDKLEVGDAIIKVRQEDEQEAISVIGMRLDDAVKLIKGPKGSNVILTLKKVDGTIEDLSIPRDEILLEETYAKSTKWLKTGLHLVLLIFLNFILILKTIIAEMQPLMLKRKSSD